MKVPTALRDRLAEKYGSVIDLQHDPGALDRLIADVAAAIEEGRVEPVPTVPVPGITPAPSPFGVSWMDSWVAHWVYSEQARMADRRGEAVGDVMRQLVDLKFEERLGEIRDFLRTQPHAEPPDGGVPEPGVPPAPPAGPATVFSPPDGGVPEPGVPPSPPAGPASGFLGENPWILYWFVSLKAPQMLDVIDVHLSRRMSEIGAGDL